MNNEIFKPLSQLNLNKKQSYSPSLFEYAKYNFYNVIRLAGLRIAENHNLTENDIEQYIEIMDKLIKDDFISNKLKNWKESNENLELQINEIKQEINPIVEAIDKELYDTKARCCPTFLRVIRNYFF